MARRYTRKQLKQPDEFITLSHKVWVWVREHATRVAVMLGVAVVIIAAAWTLTYLLEKRAKTATATIMRGLEIYTQDVVAAGEEIPKTSSGIPRFTSRKEKLEAAIRQFSEVVSQRGTSSDVGKLALLMRASTRYDLGDYTHAIADYTQYLGTRKGQRDPLFIEAVEGLAYSYEALKKWDDALASLKRLPREGDSQFPALYHEARVLAAKGDKGGAVKLYRQIVEKADSRYLSGQASQWLLALGEDA